MSLYMLFPLLRKPPTLTPNLLGKQLLISEDPTGKSPFLESLLGFPAEK